jgi:hypothetical protein
MAEPATMTFISAAQIATAQAAIVAAVGASLSLDVYELPYGAADDPAYAGASALGGYSLNSPKLLFSGVTYNVNNPYTNDLAWMTNNTLNTTSGAMIAGRVYLVAGTVLGTR